MIETGQPWTRTRNGSNQQRWCHKEQKADRERLWTTKLVSRKHGRPSNLVRARYADFGPTLACEKLTERHGFDLSRETLRRWMIDAGLWILRAQRQRRLHQPRHRRACLGELVQIDGCEHAWFEDRGPTCTLLVYVDDATSRLLELRLVASESTFDYFTSTRAYLEHHGKPVAFYSDKASIFRVGGGQGSEHDTVRPRPGRAQHRHRLREHPLAARGESRSYEGSTQSIRRTTLTRMAMGTRETDQPPLWIATSDLPTSPGHPFYARLTTLLDGHHFDRFVEGLCDRFYAPVMGRPSLAPGRYFRLLLVGYFEGIDSERGIAWRATDSLAVRSFLRLAVDEAPPDHSTIARTRRLIDLETHRTVFTWVQQRLVEAGRLTGKTIAIDATTLEANAAMRSIVRRDTGESDQAFLAGLATASGVETPTREGLARLDRKRKKKTSNTDWTNPHDPDAKVTKMKDGRTHLARKAEHAVDMETGAIVAVTRQGADVGDTTTIIETAIAATEQVEDAQANVDDRQSLEEIVGDKGYHSNQTLIDLDAGGIRSYVSEPDRGRRDWSKDPEARAPVSGNRRRMRGRRGRRLMRQRGERIERSFAHLYDTGGMRRTHLRGHTNILKRLLIHAGGFNLGLVMRHLIGIGTPRGLQGRVAAVLATLGVLMGVVRRRLTTISSSHRLIPAVRGRLASLATFAVNSSAAITCTTGC